MCALLDDVAVLHHEDEVRVFDRREAVGYDEARAVHADSEYPISLSNF